jgi:hypothetical protein
MGIANVAFGQANEITQAAIGGRHGTECLDNGQVRRVFARVMFVCGIRTITRCPYI